MKAAALPGRERISGRLVVEVDEAAARQTRLWGGGGLVLSYVG